MLELGSSGSARGVSSNGHPYRDPRSGPDACHLRRRHASDGVPLSDFPPARLPRQQERDHHEQRPIRYRSPIAFDRQSAREFLSNPG